MNEPQAGVTRTVIRRRRSLRHRRNRRIRRILLVLSCVAFTAVLSAIALRVLSPSLFHVARRMEPDRQSAEASREILVETQKDILRQMEGRAVYPYSVIPGGVRDARELKYAADHDPVVAAHYAGFDYDHARVVKLVLARTVYLSYRIGNKVYWTRHRVRLKKGESVITDGKITARTRCANRVEELPQQATSESEPPVAKFEQPAVPDLGTASNTPPVPFQSSLNRNPLPGVGPAPPLTAYDPLGNGGFTPILPPPLPSVCGVGKKPGSGTTSGGGTVPVTSNENKKKGDPCASGSPGGEVPEPGTWLLIALGGTAILWKARQRLVRSRSSS